MMMSGRASESDAVTVVDPAGTVNAGVRKRIVGNSLSARWAATVLVAMLMTGRRKASFAHALDWSSISAATPLTMSV